MDDDSILTSGYVRMHFARLIRRVEHEDCSFVIQKEGTPRALLLSVSTYLRLTMQEPEVLRAIGRESKETRTNRLSTAEIERIIKVARRHKHR